jgi:hypothetical protein
MSLTANVGIVAIVTGGMDEIVMAAPPLAVRSG